MPGALRRVLLAVSFVALLGAVPATAFGQGTFECDTVWDGPNADNNLEECVLNVSRMLSQWTLFIIPFFNALIVAVLVVGFPITLILSICCNCCHCCGPNCCKPETAKSQDRARCCLWLYIFYALIWSVMMFFLIIYGSQAIMKGAPQLVDDTISGPLVYFNHTVEAVMDYTYDWSSGERKEPAEFSIDLSEFTLLQEKVLDIAELVRTSVFSQFDKAVIASYVIGSLGFVMVLLILPFAKFRCCIPGFPMSISVVYWVFGVVFGALGLLVSILAYFSTLTCGEVAQHFDRDPGMIQWYGVPVCKQSFDFHKLNSDIMDAEKHLSQGVCGALLPFCDKGEPLLFKGNPFRPPVGPNGVAGLPNSQGSPSFLSHTEPLVSPGSQLPGARSPARVASSRSTLKSSQIPHSTTMSGGGTAGSPAGVNLGDFPDVGKLPDLPNTPILNCGGGITEPSQCRTFDAMTVLLLGTEIKGELGACGVPGKPCNLTECVKTCVIPEMQRLAILVLGQAEWARNVSIAWSYGRPLLECNFVFDKVVESLHSCGDITAGTQLLGAGFLVGAIVFALGIYIMLRGACVWGDLPLFTQPKKP